MMLMTVLLLVVPSVSSSSTSVSLAYYILFSLVAVGVVSGFHDFLAQLLRYIRPGQPISDNCWELERLHVGANELFVMPQSQFDNNEDGEPHTLYDRRQSNLEQYEKRVSNYSNGYRAGSLSNMLLCKKHTNPIKNDSDFHNNPGEELLDTDRNILTDNYSFPAFYDNAPPVSQALITQRYNISCAPQLMAPQQCKNVLPAAETTQCCGKCGAKISNHGLFCSHCVQNENSQLQLASCKPPVTHNSNICSQLFDFSLVSQATTTACCGKCGVKKSNNGLFCLHCAQNEKLLFQQTTSKPPPKNENVCSQLFNYNSNEACANIKPMQPYNCSEVFDLSNSKCVEQQQNVQVACQSNVRPVSNEAERCTSDNLSKLKTEQKRPVNTTLCNKHYNASLSDKLMNTLVNKINQDSCCGNPLERIENKTCNASMNDKGWTSSSPPVEAASFINGKKTPRSGTQSSKSNISTLSKASTNNCIDQHKELLPSSTMADKTNLKGSAEKSPKRLGNKERTQSRESSRSKERSRSKESNKSNSTKSEKEASKLENSRSNSKENKSLIVSSSRDTTASSALSSKSKDSTSAKKASGKESKEKLQHGKSKADRSQSPKKTSKPTSRTVSPSPSIEHRLKAKPEEGRSRSADIKTTASKPASKSRSHSENSKEKTIKRPSNIPIRAKPGCHQPPNSTPTKFSSKNKKDDSTCRPISAPTESPHVNAKPQKKEENCTENTDCANVIDKNQVKLNADGNSESKHNRTKKNASSASKDKKSSHQEKHKRRKKHEQPKGILKTAEEPPDVSTQNNGEKGIMEETPPWETEKKSRKKQNESDKAKPIKWKENKSRSNNNSPQKFSALNPFSSEKKSDASNINMSRRISQDSFIYNSSLHNPVSTTILRYQQDALTCQSVGFKDNVKRRKFAFGDGVALLQPMQSTPSFWLQNAEKNTHSMINNNCDNLNNENLMNFCGEGEASQLVTNALLDQSLVDGTGKQKSDKRTKRNSIRRFLQLFKRNERQSQISIRNNEMLQSSQGISQTDVEDANTNCNNNENDCSSENKLPTSTKENFDRILLNNYSVDKSTVTTGPAFLEDCNVEQIKSKSLPLTSIIVSARYTKNDEGNCAISVTTSSKAGQGNDIWLTPDAAFRHSTNNEQLRNIGVKENNLFKEFDSTSSGIETLDFSSDASDHKENVEDFKQTKTSFLTRKLDELVGNTNNSANELKASLYSYLQTLYKDNLTQKFSNILSCKLLTIASEADVYQVLSGVNSFDQFIINTFIQRLELIGGNTAVKAVNLESKNKILQHILHAIKVNPILFDPNMEDIFSKCLTSTEFSFCITCTVLNAASTALTPPFFCKINEFWRNYSSEYLRIWSEGFVKTLGLNEQIMLDQLIKTMLAQSVSNEWIYNSGNDEMDFKARMKRALLQVTRECAEFEENITVIYHTAVYIATTIIGALTYTYQTIGRLIEQVKNNFCNDQLTPGEFDAQYASFFNVLVPNLIEILPALKSLENYLNYVPQKDMIIVHLTSAMNRAKEMAENFRFSELFNQPSVLLDLFRQLYDEKKPVHDQLLKAIFFRTLTIKEGEPDQQTKNKIALESLLQLGETQFELFHNCAQNNGIKLNYHPNSVSIFAL